MKVKVILAGTFCLFLLIPARTNAQWVVDSSPYYGYLSLAVMGNNLIAVCGGEVFRSTDLGNTWLDANNGIPFASDVTELYPFRSDIFVLSGFSGLEYSTDTGNSWQGRYDNHVYLTEDMSAIVSFGDTILVNEAGPGLFRSTDTGNSWAQFPSDTLFPSDKNIRSLAAIDGFEYAGCQIGGIFRSSDGGVSWANVLQISGSNNPVLSMSALGSYVYAGTSLTGIFISSDYGMTWDSANTGILPNTRTVQALLATPNGIFAGLLVGGGVYYSSDSGRTWFNFTDGMTGGSIECLDTGLGYLFAGGQYGIYRRPLSDFNNLGVVSSSVSNSTSISVFPNPVTQTLHVMPGPAGTLRLFDLLSRERGEANDDGSGVTLDVSKLEAGTYFLRIGSESEKVEIQH